MKKLLAIINEPEKSKKFIKYVSYLASELHAHVYLLYVLPPESYPIGVASTGGIMVSQIQRNLKKEAQHAKEQLDGYLNDIKKEFPDIFVEKMVKTGAAISIIKAFVEDNNTSMIILENRAGGSWLEVANNMKIIENVDLPVLVIPKDADYKTLKVIIYATDYLEADVPTLKKLVYLTNNFQPKIIALHITDNLDFNEIIKKMGFLDMIRKVTAYDNINVEALTVSANMSISEVINDYTSQIKGDLVVVLKENQNFLQRIFTTLPSETIIKKSEVPVLVYNENS